MLMGGTRPGRTHKKPKNLSACDREERGRGEGGVSMLCACVNEVHWNLEGAGWQEHSQTAARMPFELTRKMSLFKCPMALLIKLQPLIAVLHVMLIRP